MTGKIAGACLLMLSGALICRSWISEKRRDIRLTDAFAAALEQMEGEIRWQNLPMPRILQGMQKNVLCGEFFQSVCGEMRQGADLYDAWQKACGTVPVKAAEDLLRRVELRGDAQQIMGSLHLAADEVHRLAAAMTRRQRQNERLCMALGGCLTAMLVIVLI